MPASPSEPLRIANCSGFYGDRFSAAREMVQGGPIDVLTGDYLAELTMLILWKAMQKDAQAGYAATFLRQMEEVLGTCVERKIKIVSNAGGLNPRGLADRLRQLAAKLGLAVRIAHVEGDDVRGKLPELLARGERLAHLDTGHGLAESGIQPVTANAYLGGWAIAQALARDVDVVVCGRVTDASLVVGPAAWHFGWRRDDWDRLAGAVVAGHVLECGPQATGGNYSFFREIAELHRPGFPIAEMHADGSSVITKHPGTGGAVSVGTVTAQLLYEIDSPAYANPDVVARFDTIQLEQVGADRVRISGVRGEPPPRTAKVCINYVGGFRNSATLVLTGLDIEAKANLALDELFSSLGGRESFGRVDVQLVRHDRPDPATNENASALLRINVRDRDPSKVGRAFSNAAIEMALANYPGFYATSPPTAESPYGVYWPTLIPADAIEQVVVLESGERIPVAWTAGSAESNAAAPSSRPSLAQHPRETHGLTRRVPLGMVVGARSGDKGGNANVGIWARTPAAFEWLREMLDEKRFRALLAEARDLPVRRYELPNLHALNFVVVGLLGEGVASSTRTDAQAKSLGEYLRAKVVDVPVELLSESQSR